MWWHDKYSKHFWIGLKISSPVLDSEINVCIMWTNKKVMWFSLYIFVRSSSLDIYTLLEWMVLHNEHESTIFMLTEIFLC